MKKVLLLICCIFLAGCSSLNSFMNSPKEILKDPHYKEYQHKEIELERAYLHGQITYAGFIQQKKQLDEDYARDVQERDAIIMGEE